MNKYAAEKIASEYYSIGAQLAIQTLNNTGSIKTASRGKGLAKMLGMAGAGAGAGALGMRAMTPEISNVLAKMTPSELAVVAKNVGGSRLAKADEVTQQMVSRLNPQQMEPGVIDSIRNLDLYERLAMGGQAAKNMLTDPMNTLKAVGLAGQDNYQGLKMTAESVMDNPKVRQLFESLSGAARRGSEHMASPIEHL